MNEATIALTVMTFLIFAIFVGFLIWGLRSGQFKNVEEATLIPFREDQSSDPAQAECAVPGDSGADGHDKGEGR